MDIKTTAGNPSSFFPLPAKPTIFVITGGRGVGKTTYCRKAVDGFRQAGLRVAGLLSPGRFVNDQKNGIVAVDLTHDHCELIASSIPGEIEGIRLGPWTFDPRVLEWGNQLLLNSTEADLLVIDELGYLEFNLNTGWTAGFDALSRKIYRLALVVIRPECIGPFTKMGFNFRTLEILGLQAPLGLTP